MADQPALDPSAARTLSIEIVTPEAMVWEGDAHSVSLPSVSGSMSVRPRHEPAATVLSEGTVLVRPVGAAPFQVRVAGGYMVVDDDDVSVLVDRATVPEVLA